MSAGPAPEARVLRAYARPASAGTVEDETQDMI